MRDSFLLMAVFPGGLVLGMMNSTDLQTIIPTLVLGLDKGS